jgi:hypothetical protein
MPQPPFQTDVLQIEPSSGDTLLIERDASDGSLLFKDAQITGGIKLQDLAGLNSFDNVFVVGLPSSGAKYNTVQSALDDIPVTSSASSPNLILIGPGVFDGFTLDKDGVFIYGLGGSYISPSTSISTITIQQGASSVPKTVHIENVTISNPYTGKRCVEILGGTNSEVGREDISFINCNLVASGVGGYQFDVQTSNILRVQGGSWRDSSSTSLTNVFQSARVILRDIDAINNLQFAFDNSNPKPVVVDADYQVLNCGKVGTLVATLDGLGSVTIGGSTDCGTMTFNGDRTHNMTGSRIQNLILNDTTIAQLLATSLLVKSGTGTLLVWDGSAFSPPGGGGGPGEVNTASNVGLSGEGVFLQKQGTDLQFKNLDSVGTILSITNNVGNNTLDLDIVEGNIDHDNISNVGTNTHAQIDAHIADVANPHAVTKTQVGLGNVEDILSNFSAVVDPTVTDDSGSGYAEGSLWVNTNNDRAYTCVDASVGAAVWKWISIVDHTELTSVGTNTHAQIDTHIASTANPHSVTKAQVGLGDVENILNNVAIIDPTTANDSSQGYSVDSKWLNTATGRTFVCVDNTLANAIWRTFDPDLQAIPPTITDDINNGYYPGSRWIVAANQEEYLCIDNAVGAAIWVETTEQGLQGVVIAGGAPVAGEALIATGAATAEWALPPGAAGGEANTMDNVGTSGEGLFKQKVGVEFQMRNIDAGSSIVTVAQNAGNDTVEVDVDPSQIDHDALINVGTNSHDVIDSHLASTANPHNVTPSQLGNSIAQWNANEIQGVSISSSAPQAGYVLTALNSSSAQWATPSTPRSQVQLDMSQVLDTSNSDWAISMPATIEDDGNNNAFTVARFSGTVEQGVGFYVDIPAGSTQIKFTLISRAVTLPSTCVFCVPKLYFRRLEDNAMPSNWTSQLMTKVELPGNVFFQRDEESFLLTDFDPDLVAGGSYQFELTRDYSNIDDDLIGDWNLLRVLVEVS